MKLIKSLCLSTLVAILAFSTPPLAEHSVHASHRATRIIAIHRHHKHYHRYRPHRNQYRRSHHAHRVRYVHRTRHAHHAHRIRRSRYRAYRHRYHRHNYASFNSGDQAELSDSSDNNTSDEQDSSNYDASTSNPRYRAELDAEYDRAMGYNDPSNGDDASSGSGNGYDTNTDTDTDTGADTDTSGYEASTSNPIYRAELDAEYNRAMGYDDPSDDTNAPSDSSEDYSSSNSNDDSNNNSTSEDGDDEVQKDLSIAISLIPQSQSKPEYQDTPREAKMFRIAYSKRGNPYVYGATGPYYFDCSGFTQYVFRHGEHIRLPRTAQEQYNAYPHVRNAQRGELVFFGANHRNISHVGLCVDNANMIDAQDDGVKVERIHAPWWHLQGYDRVLPR